MCKYMIIPIVCFIPLQAIAAEQPSVSELLEKYAETQDKLQECFIIKSKVSSTYSGVVFGGALKADKLKTYSVSELRYDGSRISMRSYEWGQIEARKKEFIPRDKASYYSNLWDGQMYFNYQRHPAEGYPIGTVTIYQKPSERQIEELINYNYCGHEIFGFLYGEYERVDKVLRKTANISVRDKLEQIGSSNCYVIDAMTQGGKYTLWIDPQHGCNIAKAIVRWGENVPPCGQAHWRVKNALNSLENVSFGKIKNLWVPVEVDIGLERTWHNGEWTKQSWHHKITEVDLDIDLQALGSFVPDDIKNGAETRIVTADGTLHYKEKYIWQDGQVVDDKGNVILDCRSKEQTKK